MQPIKPVFTAFVPFQVMATAWLPGGKLAVAGYANDVLIYNPISSDSPP